MKALDAIRSKFKQTPTPPKRKRSARSFSLAVSGRDSKIDPYYRSGTLRAIKQPKGQRKFAIERIKAKELNDANLSDAIRILIDSSDALSLAVDTAIDYTIDDYSIEPMDADNAEDVAAVEIINDFIETHEKGNEPFISTLKRIAYDLHVEGGGAAELVKDEMGMPRKIVSVSPLTLTTRRIYPKDDPRYREYGTSRTVYKPAANDKRDNPETTIGEYDQIIQPTGSGVADYTVLQDEMYPNPYFVYAPFTIRAAEKLGSATVEPALFGVTSITDLISMIMDYTKGQVFPKGVVQIEDPTALQGLDDEEIVELMNTMAKDVEAILSDGDETQTTVLAHKIVFTLIGSLERANLDGADMIFELLERIIQRGTKFPRVMFGGRQRGGGLGDQTSRIEWVAFNRRVGNARRIKMAIANKFFKVITGLMGNSGTATLVIADNDLEMRLIESEALKLKGDAFMAIDGLGIFTKGELRQKFIDPSPDWSNMPTELPEELETMMNDPMMSQDPEDTDA